MKHSLQISSGAYSSKGRKKLNQDFHGTSVPSEPLLTSKGVATALADGISSSQVSQEASETAVVNFLDDYLCTSEAWSVKKSGFHVLNAVNSWLVSLTQKSDHRFNKDKGYVCTFSGLVIKSRTAHLFHVGDSRIYLLRHNELKQLTEDHRIWLSEDKSYLSRGLGINPTLEIDYQALTVEEGDQFLLTTDGIYEFLSEDEMVAIINQGDDLESAAKQLVEQAYEANSDDNLTVQLLRVETLPEQDSSELYKELTVLPFPPVLEPGQEFDGYKIVRTLSVTSRSSVYLATDVTLPDSPKVVIKVLSADKHDDNAYIERFLMEEWVARRINSPHVLRACEQKRKRNFMYIVTEYIEGQTLAQWMIDNPKPNIEQVRNLIEQIAKGLNAFHRQEMLHQDLKPENVLINQEGVAKIIDFGATKVAGISEILSLDTHQDILGTAQYTAPEYFLGEAGSARSDNFSLAVIAYQMLSGRLPYGTKVAQSRTKASQDKLRYVSVLNEKQEIPVWIDFTLKKALQPNPLKRYAELTEFVYDLRHPNKEFMNKTRPPLLERNPLAFWKGLSLFLAIVVVYLLASPV